MYFDYMGYVRECLNLSAEGVVLDILGIIILIIILFHKKIVFYGKQILILFILLGAIESLCMDAGQLHHGGIYLIQEKQADAVRMQGYITEINGLGIYSLPIIECNYYENPKYGDPMATNLPSMVFSVLHLQMAP